MRWITWMLAAPAAAPVALAVYLLRQGDADVRMDPEGCRLLAAHRGPGRLHVRFRLPAVNRGRQKGMLYEILVRPEYPGRGTTPVSWGTAVYWPGVQETGYWAAALMKPGETVPLEFEVTALASEDVLDRIVERGVLPLVIRYGVIGRSPLRWYLTEVSLPLAAEEHDDGFSDSGGLRRNGAARPRLVLAVHGRKNRPVAPAGGLRA